MLKILVADDHPVVRQGLKQIIADTDDMVVAGEASSGQEVLDEIWKGEYDVVLLDITMPGISGLDVLKRSKNMRPKVAFLVLSMHPEDQYATRALRSGASGYLTKDSAPDELIAAIRKVSEGGKYVTLSMAERLALELENDLERPLHEVLSDREYRIMCMIGNGMTIREIAWELSLSHKTVSTYRSRILEKTKMRNNAEIIKYVIQNRLTD